MPKNGIHPTDSHVGKRVRMRRLMLGLSQTELGDALGLTFQQVQKYEKGANRISASRLQRISQIFQVPVFFFLRPSAARARTARRTERRSVSTIRIRLSRHARRAPSHQSFHADTRPKASTFNRQSGGADRPPRGSVNPEPGNLRGPHQHKNRHHPTSRRPYTKSPRITRTTLSSPR
jgi:transcriptional regulator with XRE-family HTH domain